MFQILIVEDDKELSQLFQKVLEKNGYQVKSASDGALALEILDKEYIDLIISDIMMPVMDGYELVSELRSAGYQIPVLMITSGNLYGREKASICSIQEISALGSGYLEQTLRGQSPLYRYVLEHDGRLCRNTKRADYNKSAGMVK